MNVHVIRYRPGRDVVAQVGPSRVRAMFSPDGRHVMWSCSVHGRGSRPGCECTHALAAATPDQPMEGQRHD